MPGSKWFKRERMKYFAEKSVQAHNEVEKCKALGRPGIVPRMAAKKKKKPTVAQAEASRQKVKEICPRGNNKVIIYFLIS